MDSAADSESLAGPRKRIRERFCADESATLGALVDLARNAPAARDRIAKRAAALIESVRASRGALDLETLLQQFSLATREGVLLLTLAEALARVPDGDTVDRLVEDKLGPGDWRRHDGDGSAAGVALARLLDVAAGMVGRSPEEVPRSPARRGRFEILRRRAVAAGARQAIEMLARRFVMGTDIDNALVRSATPRHAGSRFSYDILGEAALTSAAAARYLSEYGRAIEAIGTRAGMAESIHGRPGISVKLSALHPRFELSQRRRCVPQIARDLSALARAARDRGIALTVDAEETDRLELSLDIFEQVFGSPELAGYEGLGLAVQAYQKRALPVVEWAVELARSAGRRIPVRLVKGAYWDGEIKRAQALGLDGYPVFTRKAATDVSYLACASRLLDSRQFVYPQFATHNALTVAAILERAGDARGYEFQRLHGMGQRLYRALRGEYPDVPCRVYAPVGSHRELLPYLVRRLLENGAGNSFVHLAADPSMPLDVLLADPVDAIEHVGLSSHPRVPVPTALYGEARLNSRGVAFGEPTELARLIDDLRSPLTRDHVVGSLVAGGSGGGERVEILSPADRRVRVGEVWEASPKQIESALRSARAAAPTWDEVPAGHRAEILERAADAFEGRRSELVALLVREAGKTLPDAVAEVRECVDYCRYYAIAARRDFGEGETLPAVAGEGNRWRLRGRGVFVAISPWNFPLAIFAGQVAGALAAGNAVVAKPARQTPLVAHRAVQILHDAGVPADVLSYLPGPGETTGRHLVEDPRVDGVAFTGSTATARSIAMALAQRAGPIAPLIAETGGQNAMIVDSSALLEQAVVDVVQSAFLSAGQRCSALRVLFVQKDIADALIELLAGAMDELVIGDPASPETDIGPVIDAQAAAVLDAHVAWLGSSGREIHRLSLPAACRHGSFFAPGAWEIDRLDRLEREVFGPVLHVIRFDGNAVDAVVDAVNATGYGLTLGIQSRIESTVRRICRRARVGNIYVNRNMVGAVVGSQPFGGQGLSGTGPKAGGPLYLHRFAVEATTTVNTAAAGGNASLMMLDDGLSPSWGEEG